MRSGGLSSARCCLRVGKGRYCSWGAAHARWCIVPSSPLPPCEQKSVLQLGSRARAVVHCQVLGAAGLWAKVGTASGEPRTRSGAIFFVFAAASVWAKLGTAAWEPRMRGGALSPSSLLLPDGQKSVMQPVSRACAVAHLPELAAAAVRTEVGTAARSRACAVALFYARLCRPVHKSRYCRWGAALRSGAF